MLFDIKRQFPHAISLGYRLAARNIKAKYRMSALGLLWALIPPLATAGIWIVLQSQQVVAFQNVDVPYPVFVLLGTLLWQIFSESINFLIQNLQQNRNLLTKINFPREALIYSAGGEIMFNLAIKFVLLVLTLIAFKIPLSFTILLSLTGIFGLVLLGLTIGLLLSPLALLFKDIQLGLPLALQFALYLTPVIYPEPNYQGITKILAYNPVIPLLQNSREWMLGHQPKVGTFFLVLFGTALFFLLGLVLFKLSMKIIIERIGA